MTVDSFDVTGGERTRVSADTLVKIAEDSFIASVNYRQIYRHGVAGIRNTEAEFQVVIGFHSAVIPT